MSPSLPPQDDDDRDRLPPEIEDEPEVEVEEIVDFDDEDIADVTSALAADRQDIVRRLLAELTPADTAELLEKIDPLEREQLLTHHGDELDPEVFIFLEKGICTRILEQMSARQVAAILAELDSDDALGLIVPLDDAFRGEIIRHLSAKTRVALEEGLSFPEDSAGRLMQREFVAIPQFWTVGKTVDYLRAAASDLPDDFLDIYVITPTYHVVGKVPLSKLLKAGRGEKIDQLVREEPIYPVPAAMDQEEVALLFKREGLTSAPVVDDDERLIGVITVDDVVDVIDEEAEEDFLKLAGVENSDFYKAIFQTAGSRFRWLFVNMGTALLSTIVISQFGATIEQLVALAALMPIVASLGGNAGTQALTVAVRALATKELSSTNMWRAISKEALVGILNGCGTATLIGLAAGFWFGSPLLGGVIGMAIVINLTVAGLFGAAIPLALDRMGADPAVSSSVFLTMMTDVIGFLAFLGLATLLLI